MTDGNTYLINKHLDEREDYDALQEVTAELEQAEARIEELEAKLKAKEKLVLAIAGDKIDLVSELAGVKGNLAEVVEALGKSLAAIDDYIEYEHDGDPWSEDARVMNEMDIDHFARDGGLEAARAALAQANQGDKQHDY